MSHAPPTPSRFSATRFPIGPLALSRHPAFAGPAMLDLQASLCVRQHSGGAAFVLRFHATGPMAELQLPAAAPAGPADGLWQHTCFEAFVGSDRDAGYREFNFAPSGQWAAYRFAAERLRDTADAGGKTAPMGTPSVQCRCDAHNLWLEAELPVQALPEAHSLPLLRIGLSAVIEERGGRLSYWALHHPGARPDFHHPAGFALSAPHPFPPNAPRAPSA